MKARKPQEIVRVPLVFGRAEGDMISWGRYEQQLDLFRQVLDPHTKVLTLALMALTPEKYIDYEQEAGISKIAETMGFTRTKNQEGWNAFHPEIYQQITTNLLKLRRRDIVLPIREFLEVKDGRTPGGTRKVARIREINTSLLQSFTFIYDDDVNLAALTANQRQELKAFVYPSEGAPSEGDSAVWALPELDGNGNIIRNQDGTPRRRRADAVAWQFSSVVAGLVKEKSMSWLVRLEDVQTINRYRSDPMTFELMWKTLFHTGNIIEYSYDKLVKHLGVDTDRNRNRARIEAAVERAFDNLLKEGFIDKPVTIKEPGHWPTTKSGRPRRAGRTYQWSIAKSRRAIQNEPEYEVIDPSPSPDRGS